MLASLLRIILLTATLKILERGLDKGPIIHENSYFTNDLIYELIGGVLNIRSNRLDMSNSLASPDYKYTRDTLTTFLGRYKLTEDIHENDC